MDKAKHQLLEHFLDAARTEPGISEQEAWEILQQQLDNNRKTAGRWWRILLPLAALLVLAGTAVILLRTPLSEQQPMADIRTASPAPRPAVTPDSSGAQPKEPASLSQSVPSLEPGTPARQNGSALPSRHKPKVPDTPAYHSEPPEPTIPAQLPAQPDIEQLNRDLGMAASKYWLMHLNAYRTRLAQLLSASDLAALERTRARYAILAWQVANDTSDIEVRRNDLVQTFHSTSAIAEHYPEEFLALRGLLMQHFTEYFTLIRSSIDQFVTAHGDPAADDLDSLRADMAMADTAMAWMSRPEGAGDLSMVFTLTAEPTVMLYDGNSLHTVMDRFELALRSAGMIMNTRSIPGFAALPTTTQGYATLPDTASDTLAVDVTAVEPGSPIALTIRNEQGEVATGYSAVASIDGSTRIALDIATLPPGIYLTQLTFTTSEGEQRNTQIMHVSRQPVPLR